MLANWFTSAQNTGMRRCYTCNWYLLFLLIIFIIWYIQCPRVMVSTLVIISIIICPSLFAYGLAKEGLEPYRSRRQIVYMHIVLRIRLLQLLPGPARFFSAPTHFVIYYHCILFEMRQFSKLGATTAPERFVISDFLISSLFFFFGVSIFMLFELGRNMSM